ncbi:stage V sporulation protein AB [Anaeromicropila herbilytica]|uniref:Stage V sporulation protein AB n=1 Tax=Anaeromicropila herbilytica TaxID=2785025 RepID=A0A7R7EK10_9FIRM|nr:stage V sporulation protein AB [Anaeromicropila herbilytica]BCN30031.1 hypothetical protein bsdtb5_13260 [Anaeromicropila herbilytica]
MIVIKVVLLFIMGLSFGVIVAAGVFAFITMIGIIPRFAARTNTAKHILVYEDMVIYSGIIANTINIFHIEVSVGKIGLIIFGLFSGIFVGCLAIALAEVLQVIPIFFMRAKLTKGISIIVISIALGKAVGAFYQLYLNAGP